MNYIHTVFCASATAFLSTIIFMPAHAEAAPQWQLPLEVTAENTKVDFEVDTTWHVVHGHATEAQGKVWLEDPSNQASVHAEIRFPLSAFRTGMGMRDSSLRDHMDAEQFPEVLLRINALTGDCTPEKAVSGGCTGTLEGQLQIKDVTREVSLPASISYSDHTFVINGKVTFPWADYNVKDPSIIMAKVQPDVTVEYTVKVPEAEMGAKDAGHE